MSNLNTDVLIQNITQLMKNNGVTQEKLADILGMSQPNVSKALSSKDKKCFTLDQVVGIANYFGVSLDQLVGNTVPNALETGPRAIARFLADIIEGHIANYITIEKEEEIFNVNVYYGEDGPYTDHEIVHRNVSYPAIYLPDYWKVPRPKDPDDIEAMDLCGEAEQAGNETRMKPVNDFLRKFIQIYEIHESKGVDDDAYNIVVGNYLSKLREK